MRKREVWFNVTKKDNTEGVCGSPSKCAVARAIARRLAPNFRVHVGANTACFFRLNRNRNRAFSYVRLPKEVCDFISAFDWAEDVQPFRFKLKVYAHLFK